MVTKAVALEAATPVVRAPAKVAFRDGAVSQLSVAVPGRVTIVHVKTGDRVKVGDPLITLASPDAAAARASYAAARAEHEASRTEVDRQDRMASSGVGIETERAGARTKLRQVEAELARAQITAGLLGDGGGSVVVLRAPIEGTVIARRATVGSIVQPGGDPLIELGNPTALWVVAEVFERDLVQVQDNAEVDVEVSTEAHPIKGHVVSVGSAVTGNLRTAPVYIALDDGVGSVRAGMFARAVIKAPAGRSIVLPSEAVLVKDGKKYIVYVKRGTDSFTPREVSIGRSIDGTVQVLGGITEGDQVVVKGALLIDGAAEQLL